VSTSFSVATREDGEGPNTNRLRRRWTAATLISSVTLLVVALGNSAYATRFVGPSGRTHGRTMLSFLALSSVHGANHFLLRRAGADLQLIDSDTGTVLREVALTRTSGVSIKGADGHVENTLTLDFSGGSLAVPRGISYDGGRGGYNVLALHGGHFAEEHEVARTPHSGLIVLGDTTVHYAEIAPITDTSTVTNFTINGTAAAETINVVNGPIVGGVQTTQVNSATKTFELVNFAHKTNVMIKGEGGNDAFNLNNSTPAVGLSSLTVDSSERAVSTFNVIVSTVPLSLVGGGTDTANIGVNTAQTITSSVAISDPEEFINVNVNDSENAGSSRFVTVNFNGVTDTISGLTLSTVTAQASDLASLTLSGGSVGNTFVIGDVGAQLGRSLPVTLNTGAGVDSTFVQNIATGTSLAIHGQSGEDGVSVSNAGSLTGIHGPVSIENAGSPMSVVLDGSNDTKAQLATLSSDGTTDTITGLAPSNITVKASDLKDFTLDGGSGGNTFVLDGLGAVGTATLNTGIGPDTVNVQPTSSVGPLNINGQAGSDTVNLGSAGSVQQLTGVVNVTNGAATTLTVNDTSDPTARAVTVGTTAVTGLAPAPINFAGVPALTIDGGGPSDTFAVTPSATTTDDIVGGGPASTTPPGNALNMNLTGTTSPALTGTTAAAGAQGAWEFANRNPVSFSHMQSLNPTALSVGDTATTVGGSGSSPLVFPVSLLAATALPVSATYATADGSATAASGAYQPASGTVFFPVGATNETVLVSALGMPTVRPPQTLVLGLVAPVNALLARSVATGTITDSFLPASSGPPLLTPAAVTPPPPAVAPVLTNLTQSHTSWREGKARAVISSSAKRRAPLGTSFSFDLNESASVTLAFNQSTPGRKTGGRCVKQTKKNRSSRACRRVVTQGTLPISAHAGIDRVSFQGRFSPTGTLKRGQYTLVATAISAAGQGSPSSSLTFTIVK
jgi:hypothetical protein